MQSNKSLIGFCLVLFCLALSLICINLNATTVEAGGTTAELLLDDTPSASSGPGSFTVDSPISSAYWSRGGGYSITWTDVSAGAMFVDIYLFYNGGGDENVTVVEGTGNDGTHFYAVPYDLVESTTDYWIIVYQTGEHNDYGVSQHFNIHPKQTISLSKPDSDTTWTVNDTVSIEWTWDNYMPNVDIELFLNDVFNQILASSEPCSGYSDSYSWKIPEDLMESDKYQIKVKHSTQPTIEYGFSDYFTITRTPEDDKKDDDDDTPAEDPLPEILMYSGIAGAVGAVSVVLIRRRRIAGR